MHWTPHAVLVTWPVLPHLALTAVLWGDDYFFLSLLKRNQSLRRSDYLAGVTQEIVESWARIPVAPGILCLAFCHSASHTGLRVMMPLFWLETGGAHLIKTCDFSSLFDFSAFCRIYFCTTCFRNSRVLTLKYCWVLRGLLMQSKPSFWMSPVPFQNELPEPEQDNGGTTESVKEQEMKWTDLALQYLHENVPPVGNWRLAPCSSTGVFFFNTDTKHFLSV